MIKYSLKCEDGHVFESWLKSADAFDDLKRAGHLSCAICGNKDVSKAIMAPRVNQTRSLSAPADGGEEKLAALRKHVEDNASYVGGSFAQEARAMHDGTAPERAIWGEARQDEAQALVEDGVPVAPLPFLPARKVN